MCVLTFLKSGGVWQSVSCTCASVSLTLESVPAGGEVSVDGVREPRAAAGSSSQVFSLESTSLLLLRPAALSRGAQSQDAAKSRSQRPLPVSGHRDPDCRLGPSALTPALALQGVGCGGCPGSWQGSAVHRSSRPVTCRTRCHTDPFGKLHLTRVSMVGNPLPVSTPQTSLFSH